MYSKVVYFQRFHFLSIIIYDESEVQFAEKFAEIDVVWIWWEEYRLTRELAPKFFFYVMSIAAITFL